MLKAAICAIQPLVPARLSTTRLHFLRREPPAHRVLGDAPCQQELEQVIRTAGLGADARELEPAERLAVDQCAR